jgi:hypothetical protein
MQNNINQFSSTARSPNGIILIINSFIHFSLHGNSELHVCEHRQNWINCLYRMATERLNQNDAKAEEDHKGVEIRT